MRSPRDTTRRTFPSHRYRRPSQPAARLELDLSDLFHELRVEVHVASRPPLRLDVLEYVGGLLHGDADGRRQLFGAVTVIERVQRQVHLRIRQGEIKLVLALRQAVS